MLGFLAPLKALDCCAGCHQFGVEIVVVIRAVAIDPRLDITTAYLL
jgi:hypothetical protein